MASQRKPRPKPKPRAQSDRHERARKALGAYSTHAGAWLDQLSLVLRDGTALATNVLNQTEPPEQCIPDLVALYINTMSALWCCPHPPVDDGSTTPGPIFRFTPDLSTTIDFVFDIRSEASGPIRFATLAPLTLRHRTDLVSAGGGTIDYRCILVRELDDGIMISLCDLGEVPVGIYEGRLTFADEMGATVAHTVRAECRDKLWWL